MYIYLKNVNKSSLKNDVTVLLIKKKIWQIFMQTVSFLFNS